ncbi:MAG TPA: YdiU family protein [Ramlibacter sp.]|nr:YdiU family protein [Ramlibacter sp.]
MQSAATPLFRFDNSYARDLPGFYVPWKPAAAPAPRLLFLNRSLAEELGLDPQALQSDNGAAIFAGNVVPEGAEPLAQAYAGHQFGGFSPQLGDGRALLLGEVIDRQGRRRDIAFKGSGRTPFSRGGDGKAAVGPMLREVLIGEAMHALGIPTTRALAVAATGEQVVREKLLPGAVLARVAASHLRVGTFQFYAARQEHDRLRQLADYAIARHDSDLAGQPGRYLALLQRVAQRQAALIARWMNVGFIHGVMNTDNMTLSGETIDYGPCAFMEAYDPRAVFSSIDHGGRYAFSNQPPIAQWNLARFAEALLPLMVLGEGDEAADKAVEEATAVIQGFPALYQGALLQGLRAKLGLDPTAGGDAADGALANDWLGLLHAQQVDFTIAWRRLADAAAGNEARLLALFADAQAAQEWLARWKARSTGESAHPQARAARMRGANPWIIPRNHRVEEALTAASEEGDLGPFERLLAALRQPFDENPEHAAYAEPAPAAVTACYQTFCGT